MTRPRNSKLETIFKLTQTPVHVAADGLYLVRHRIAETMNFSKDKTLLMPMTKDIDPFWVTETNKGWFNSDFPGYPVMHTVIRDYPEDFIRMVDGTLVENEMYHTNLVDDFNRLYIKAIRGKGQGYPKGTLSIDQFIRMAALFYVVLKTSEMASGLVFNEMGLLSQQWCGAPKAVNVNAQQIRAYSSRLENKYFANCSWEQFFFRCLNEDLDEAVWVIDLSGADLSAESEKELGLGSLIKIFDFIPLFKSRGYDFTVVMQNTEDNIEILKYLYGFTQTGDNLYQSADLILDADGLGRRLMQIIPLSAR